MRLLDWDLLKYSSGRSTTTTLIQGYPSFTVGLSFQDIVDGILVPRPTLASFLAVLALGLAILGFHVIEYNDLRDSIASVRSSVTSAEAAAATATSRLNAELATLTSEVEDSTTAIQNICQALEDAGNVPMADSGDGGPDDEAATAINALIDSLNGIANCPTA